MTKCIKFSFACIICTCSLSACIHCVHDSHCSNVSLNTRLQRIVRLPVDWSVVVVVVVVVVIVVVVVGLLVNIVAIVVLAKSTIVYNQVDQL